jgi:hypothetical protein
LPTTQEKLESALIERKRKLYDLEISRVGVTGYLYRYFEVHDKYEDSTTLTLISNSEIAVRINYPGDIPLFRNRSSGSAQVTDAGIYLYDILPIEVYYKFSSDMEKGDFLLHVIEDSYGNKDVILLRISEVVGSFQTKIAFKRADAAPYNGDIPDEIQTKIDELKG